MLNKSPERAAIYGGLKMDDNSNVLGAPVSLAEFNYLCDCAAEVTPKPSTEMVDKCPDLELSDTRSID